MKISSDMDSGCVQSVAPPSILPSVPLSSSAGSRAGQEYVVADGDMVPNLGQKEAEVTLACGKKARAIYQIADVTGPLTSVGALCDDDNIVIFGSKGGMVLDLVTNSVTPFPRKEKRYKWEFWVPSSKTSGQGTAGKSGYARLG